MQEGGNFLIPSAEEHRQLDRKANSEEIWKAQVPEGSSLTEMEGACLGAPGEDRLTYFPLTRRENKKDNNANSGFE